MMPPFRLLQIAGLDLDAAIARPPFEMVDLCTDAPLRAVERIVEAAIEHDVDGVLFSPASPRDGMPHVMGLAAVESLQDLVESLREQDITVIVAANSNLPFWRRLVGRDAKSQLLAPGERILFHDRHDRLCAELYGLNSMDDAENPSRAAEFMIGVAPTLSVADMGSADAPRGYDYLALGAGPRETHRLNRCVAHCPGAPQAISAADQGPHGLTLVNVDGAGIVEMKFLSTASVRFESFAVAGAADAEIDDLALRMMELLESREAEASERGWIVLWTIRVHGELLNRLETPRGRSELLALLPATHEGRVVSHRIRVVPDTELVTDVPFASEFREALRERRESLATLPGRTTLVGLDDEGRHVRRIMELLAACDEQDVVDQAQRIGLRLSAAVQD